MGGRTASFIFFAARGGIRGSKDKVGGVGSHDLNNFAKPWSELAKWTISGPGCRGESVQLNDKVS